MPTVSAFADEIGPDPKLQLDTLEANGVTYLDLRGAWGTNVMKLSDAQRRDLKKMFTDRGVGVACIGSPIGKVRIDDDYKQHFDDFKRAVDLANEFDSEYIRIFSYYPPEGENIADYRGTVLDRLAQKCDYVAGRRVTLVLENESRIFGDVPERCLYLLAALPGENITAAFDPANFVHTGVQDVYETCWLPLRPYVGYFHIKDMKYGQGDKAVPVGTGDGDFDRILADAVADGYDGFLTLEPHLAAAGQFSGETGPELFGVAVKALRDLAAKVGMTLT
jgi:sugar phosphate isomerase/epimerase